MYALQWPTLSYWEYTLKEERRFRQRLQSQVRITATEYENTDLRYAHTLGHTRPTPVPSVAENTKRTFTVGSSHFAHRSSPLRDRSRSWTFSLRTARMELGEPHIWSWAASGCRRRSFLVRVWYAFKALLKIIWKLEVLEDEAAVG